MDLSGILVVLEKYGLKGLIIMASIFILTSIIRSKWFQDKLAILSDMFLEKFMKNKVKETPVIKNISESDISNHDIFNYIDFWMHSKVPTFKFSTDYRTVVFRKYLILYLNSYKENIFRFIECKKFQEMDDAMLSTSLLNLLNTIIYDYEKNSNQAGIPDVIIEKMKVKNNDTISLTMDLIEGICSSQFYSSDKNLLKIYSILNIILSILENTISGSENVCNSINGQLKGMKYTDNNRMYIEP